MPNRGTLFALLAPGATGYLPPLPGQTAAGDSWIEVVDLETYERTQLFSIGRRYASTLAVAPDLRTVYFTDGENGVVAGFDVESGDERMTISVHEPAHCFITPDGRFLLV